MSDRRCRACGAAVPAEAQWCSLCFADLREPAPVGESVGASAASSPVESAAPVAVALQNGAAQNGAAQNGAAQNGAARGGGTSVVETDPDELLGLEDLTDEAAEAPAQASAKPALTWPCLACGENVAMDLDTCPSCGSGFLAGSSHAPTTRLPVVGDITTMTRSQRLGVGAAISAAVIVVLVLILTLFGHLF